MITLATRRFFPSSLFYNGDWHTKLLSSLGTAKAETRSQEVRIAIAALEKLLAEHDECIYTLTVIREIPGGLDGSQVLRHVQRIIQDERASAALKFANAIELTLTARGSRRHVLLAANALLTEAISSAKAEVWARLRFGGNSDGKC